MCEDIRLQMRPVHFVKFIIGFACIIQCGIDHVQGVIGIPNIGECKATHKFSRHFLKNGISGDQVIERLPVLCEFIVKNPDETKRFCLSG